MRSGDPSWSRAIEVLAAGGIVACATESVWGLSCDPRNEAAVYRLLDLKRRAVDKGLILVAADAAVFATLLDDLDAAPRAAVLASWPGPYTWLVPHRGAVPSYIAGRFSTVALRVTDHVVLAGLCRAWGGALVTTSANPGGCPPAMTDSEVGAYFGSDIDYVVPGELGGQPSPSMIRDAVSGAVIRA